MHRLWMERILCLTSAPGGGRPTLSERHRAGASLVQREVGRRPGGIVCFLFFLLNFTYPPPQPRSAEKTKALPFGSACTILVFSYFCSSSRGRGFISIFSLLIMLSM